MNKGIIYYTDCELGEPIYSTVQKFILESGLPVTSASLNKSIGFGNNEVIEGKRSYTSMVKQIISCLERSTAKYVFFTEHDVLYSPSHFDFTPPRDDIFYYNENTWRWQFCSPTAIRHDRMLSLSSLCANREFVLDHHKRRLEAIVGHGFDKIDSGEPDWGRKMGYEPGTKKKKRGGFSDDDFETWQSAYPNIDIRHNKTFSSPKVSLKEFKHLPKWWDERPIEEIDGWNLKELFES